MRRLAILVIGFLFVIPISHAECQENTCIDVSADQEGKEVVITVKKGKAGSTSTTSPRTRSTSIARKPWIPWLPKPAVTRVSTPRPRVTSKPRVRTISSSQISDQVRSLLPTGTIITQPLKDPLIHEPVNFMTTVPTNFSTVIVVLRIPITIHLTALYVWDFGDGNSLVTKFPGATFYITGVQLEKGSTATSFDYRPYGTELMLCQRYYYKVNSEGAGSDYAVGWVNSTTLARVTLFFPASMRIAPTALEQSGTAGDYSVRTSGNTNTTCSAVPVFWASSKNSATTDLTVTSGLTAGQGANLRPVNTSAYLAWSAEL